MGDAFVAVANDYSALYYNPAGLARRDDSEVNLSMDFGGSSTIADFSKDINNSGTGKTDSEKVSAMSEVLNKYYGKNFGGRFGLFQGVMVHPRWGFGIIPMDASVTMTVHKQIGPAVNLLMYGDTSVTYGYGKNVDWVNNGRLSVGIATKFVNRVYTNLPLSILELAFDSQIVKKSSLREGYTLDADLGLIYSPQIDPESLLYFMNDYKPTIGLVVRNVAESGFTNSLKLVNKEKTEAPEKLYRVLDVGFKWDLPSLGIFGGRVAFDMRDIGHPAFNTRKGSHFGMEFDWTVTSWWRGQYRFGLNQSYPTVGVSALFSIFNLDLVYYGEDVGTYNTPLENKVLMAKFNMNF